MKNEILVTGSTGFLGRRLVVALESQGSTVRAHSSADGDIANCSLPMKRVSHVFHLAGKSYVPDSWQNPQAFYNANVMGTVNVLEHCRRNQAALILVSSYVYGQPQRLPITEDHPLEAANPYSHTKIIAEKTAQFYQQRFGLPLVIVRPFNIYGPGQRDSFLIPSIMRQVLDPCVSVVHVNDLRPRRDYLYVDDAVTFLLATLRSRARGIYNMGSGRSTSVAELAQLINNAVGVSKPLVSDERPRSTEIPDVVADTSRAAGELNWQARVSLADGIAATVAAERAARGWAE